MILTHEVHELNPRKYVHRFLYFDNNWDLKKISKSFYFQEKFVEFVLSCIIDHNQNLLISYSVRDNKCILTNVTPTQLDNMWLKINFE